MPLGVEHDGVHDVDFMGSGSVSLLQNIYLSADQDIPVNMFLYHFNTSLLVISDDIWLLSSILFMSFKTRKVGILGAFDGTSHSISKVKGLSVAPGNLGLLMGTADQLDMSRLLAGMI